MYEIIFYEDEKNNKPVWDHMENLRKTKDSNKTARIEYNQMVLSIEMLKRNGTKNPANITKKLDEDLWELRPGNNRILYFTFTDDKFVLLHLFRKKTQKTPAREIEQAKREIKDYLQREGGQL